MTRLIEALLSSARAGQAVARVLEDQSQDRADRMLIAGMRAGRAEHQRDSELDAEDARRVGVAAGDGASPWARSR